MQREIGSYTEVAKVMPKVLIVDESGRLRINSPWASHWEFAWRIGRSDQIESKILRARREM